VRQAQFIKFETPQNLQNPSVILHHLNETIFDSIKEYFFSIQVQHLNLQGKQLMSLNSYQASQFVHLIL